MPSADAVLVDTHALLWWQAGSVRLSATARRHIDAASRVLVSPVSCWEVAMLVAKERVRLDRPTTRWVRDLFSADAEVAELSVDVAVAAAELADFHGDPADRFLWATALRRGVPLVSKDDRMRAYAALHRTATVVW